ncbi:hypothetical protein EVAR_70529_1 [Eumeta japonica]|uniref:Uncharacterized protein n=1 Tax=Eumeta variegata TaxID=151549 RepID=A0A4C1TR09_EUMVA|nr:hypothetical protein EVAR_70529_1 [Eumeta japonica]
MRTIVVVHAPAAHADNDVDNDDDDDDVDDGDHMAGLVDRLAHVIRISSQSMLVVSSLALTIELTNMPTGTPCHLPTSSISSNTCPVSGSRPVRYQSQNVWNVFVRRRDNGTNSLPMFHYPPHMPYIHHLPQHLCG